MATAAGTAFLQRLQADPHFAAVEDVFKSAGIPDNVWESVVLSEDDSLEYAKQTFEKDGSVSTGWFMLNNRGVGANYGVSAAEDPVQAATIAAAAMAKSIASDGTQYATAFDQLRSVEKAGWPGNLSEDATRQANLSAITNGTTGVYPGSDAAEMLGGASDSVKAAAAAAAKAAGLPTVNDINGWLTNALIGAVLLGIMAGGFALLAAPQIEDAAKTAALAA